MEDPGSKISILIADSQDMFRDGVRRLLQMQPDFVVVGDTGDGERLPALVQRLKPNVLLLDMQLRKRSAMDVLREIATLKSDVRPILLTSETEEHDLMKALVLGARGIVRKDSATNLLYKSIRTIIAGGYWVGHNGIEALIKSLRNFSDLVEEKSRLQAQSLTPQQLQIVKAIVNGCSNKDIASDLSISERTVKYHLTRIFANLGVSSRMELAHYSIQNKVVTGT